VPHHRHGHSKREAVWLYTWRRTVERFIYNDIRMEFHIAYQLSKRGAGFNVSARLDSCNDESEALLN